MTISSFLDEDSLFSRLCKTCPNVWQAYCEHEFVERIGDGTLAVESFRHYLLQDYLFLIQFARAHALAVYKADDLNEMRVASWAVDNILNDEIHLHLSFCEAWGITDQDLDRLGEARANMAYTRYVLDRGVAGDTLDLCVALIPCSVGYGVIGRRLGQIPVPNNPYQAWIDAHAADSYQKASAAAITHLDRLAANRETKYRFDRLAKIFREVTLLEIDFWEMGLHIKD